MGIYSSPIDMEVIEESKVFPSLDPTPEAEGMEKSSKTTLFPGLTTGYPAAPRNLVSSFNLNPLQDPEFRVHVQSFSRFVGGLWLAL